MQKRVRVRRIGITGGIASGKSTVTTLLRQKGFTVLDADAIYHQLIAKDGALLPRLVDAFGEDILATDGTLNRRLLGERVFADEMQRKKLDALTHPAVYKALDDLAQETIRHWESVEESVGSDVHQPAVCATEKQANRLLFFDVALLMETITVARLLRLDSIWLVTASEAVRKKRVMLRDGLSAEEAEKRMAAQMSEAEKRKRASVILPNETDMAHLEKIVDEAIRGEVYA